MTNKYYKRHKKACERCQNLSEEEKDKRQKRSKKISEFFWWAKAEAAWIYQKLLFST